MQITTETNPGLEKFELSDYTGVKDYDFYSMLPILKQHIEKNIPSKDISQVTKHLTDFGLLVSGKLNELVTAAHQEGKYGELQKYDKHGNRIDEIIYCPEQLEAKKLAHEAGLVNLDSQKNWNIPFHLDHREALAYLSNLNGEAGYNCPLAMTEGMLDVLKNVATKEQREKFLPLLIDENPKYFFPAGQYLTERVGGSNIGANRTIAKKNLDDDKWTLLGEKWFCSNPSEIWVTTAKIEGSNTIGAFLVSRYKESGELNNHHILRLKNIIGSKGKVTSEVEYRGAEAYLLGRTGTGLVLLIRHVINISRMHVAISAVAAARRCFWEAKAYSKKRSAYGQLIEGFSSIQYKLTQMQVVLCTLETTIFANWTFKQQSNPIFDLLTPLLKYKGTKESTLISHEAIMIHGGNGILNDYSVLPRLHNDCIINETWEGTHNIIAQHIIKAFKKRKSRTAAQTVVEEVLTKSKDFIDKNFLQQIEKLWMSLLSTDLKKLDELQYLAFSEKIFQVLGTCFLLRIASENPSENENIYTIIAILFFDLSENGSNSLHTVDSLFLDEAIRKKIIEFS